MKKCMFRFCFVLLAFSAMIACSTMSDVIEDKQKGKGTSDIYPVTLEEAWDIAKTVFRWEGADAIEEHKEENYMLTSSGMNLVSYGAVMGAWIEKVDENSTKVTVVTKRRIKTNLFTTLTEKGFHQSFSQAVEIVKSGKPLPPTKP